MARCVQQPTKQIAPTASVDETPPCASVLVVTCAYNEAPKIGSVLDRIRAVDGIDFLVIDDGSTDDTPSILCRHGVKVIRNERTMGVGAGIRMAIQHFLDRPYDIIVFMAGNDKDDPTEISRLLDPIVNEGYDFVQGSRYLPGGGFGNNSRAVGHLRGKVIRAM